MDKEDLCVQDGGPIQGQGVLWVQRILHSIVQWNGKGNGCAKRECIGDRVDDWQSSGDNGTWLQRDDNGDNLVIVLLRSPRGLKDIHCGGTTNHLEDHFLSVDVHVCKAYEEKPYGGDYLAWSFPCMTFGARMWITFPITVIRKHLRWGDGPGQGRCDRGGGWFWLATRKKWF